jgi:hypothetical protein
MTTPTKSHTTLFITVSVLFGGNYMWANFALQSFSALEVAWGRTALAAATLAIVVLVTKDRYPRGKEIWIKLNVAALLFNTISFVGMATAVSRITTVQVSIWNALVPLVTLGFVLAFIPEENPTWRRVTGLGMGFLGAIFIAHPWSGLGDFDAFGTGAIMIREGPTNHRHGDGTSVQLNMTEHSSARLFQIEFSCWLRVYWIWHTTHAVIMIQVGMPLAEYFQFSRFYHCSASGSAGVQSLAVQFVGPR